MECKGRKRPYKRVICWSIVIILACIWAGMVFRINRKIPKTKEIMYQNDQWIPWKNGIEIKVKNGVFMDDETIRYSENVTEDILFEGEMKLLWIDMEFRNTGDESVRLDCLELGAEAVGWANIVNMDFYYAMNPEGNRLQRDLEAGACVCYSLPFLHLRQNYRLSEWKIAEEKEYYITLSLYPEKKIIPVQK